MNVPLHGLLLAGGKSTRMGRDKASMVVGDDGMTQAARAIGLLRRFCGRVYISLRDGQSPPEGGEDVPVIRDSKEAEGPLSGILGAFHEAPGAAWRVMACDLPVVSEDVLARLVERFSEESGPAFTAYASPADGLPEPLCAIYGPSAQSVLRRHAARGHICPRHIMAEESVRLLPLLAADAAALANLNTPDDLAEAEAGREIHPAWFGHLAERRGLREEMVLVTAGTDARTPFPTMKICIHDIWISPGHDFKERHGRGRMDHGMRRVGVAACDAGMGIAGDRYHGENPGSKTQITFVAREIVDDMFRTLGVADPDYSALRRNVLVSGADLNSLIGKTFSIGDAVFEGVEECKPCYWMDQAVAPGANAFLAGRGGLRCRILAGGTLRCGEADVEIVVSPSKSFRALRQQGQEASEVTDSLTAERALQIVVNGQPYSLTMQTPGAERYLVRGLLHAEGAGEGGFLLFAQSERDDATVVEVEIDCPDLPGGARRLASTSSCGLCGKESLEGLFRDIAPVRKEDVRTEARCLHLIHAEMRRRQATFTGTGGSHAAAAATADGEILCVFEDIGRHNAVDKAVGFLLEQGHLARADILAVSGRVSFEIVQKCARAGIPVLSAISAPSSLAVECAERWGLTLAGFCREDRATFYSGLGRVERQAG